MGFEITAYTRVKHYPKNGRSDSELWDLGCIDIRVGNDNYLGDLRIGEFYAYEDSDSCMIGYSTFDDFKEMLARVAVDDLLCELITFDKAYGVFGRELCKKLASDFDAVTFNNEELGSRLFFNQLKTVFAKAANNEGIVIIS